MLDPFWISQSLKCSIWFQILPIRKWLWQTKGKVGTFWKLKITINLVQVHIAWPWIFSLSETDALFSTTEELWHVSEGEFDINRKSNRQTRLSMGAAYNTGYWGKILWYSPISLQIRPTNKHQTPATIVPVQGPSHFSKMLMALMWYKMLLHSGTTWIER